MGPQVRRVQVAVAADSEDQAKQFIDADPFYQLDLVDSYTLQEWKPIFRDI